MIYSKRSRTCFSEHHFERNRFIKRFQDAFGLWICSYLYFQFLWWKAICRFSISIDPLAFLWCHSLGAWLKDIKICRFSIILAPRLQSYAVSNLGVFTQHEFLAIITSVSCFALIPTLFKSHSLIWRNDKWGISTLFVCLICYGNFSCQFIIACELCCQSWTLLNWSFDIPLARRVSALAWLSIWFSIKVSHTVSLFSSNTIIIWGLSAQYYLGNISWMNFFMDTSIL